MLTGVFTEAPSAKFVASPYGGASGVTRLTLETNDKAGIGDEARRIIIDLLKGQAT